jgi:hypothetical protein
LVETFVDAFTRNLGDDAAVAVDRGGSEHHLLSENRGGEVVSGLEAVRLREFGCIDAIEANPDETRLAARGCRSGERDGDGVAVMNLDDVCKQIVGSRG